ncbi:MAG: glycosyltransferase family 4 protein [Roseiflexaceae bacterium]|nr:glycosyltransferase family 4 protein [Roseiflexaceae bacterium]
MRVLILGLGGVSQIFRNWPERTLGQALVRAGHTVHAITYRQPDQPHLGLSERREVIDGIDVQRVLPQFFPARELLATLKSLPRPDVAHILHPRNVLAYQAVRWLKQQGIPVVWTWLGPYHDRWLVADRERPYEHNPHPENLIATPRELLRRILLELRPASLHPLRLKATIVDHFRNYAIHAPLRRTDAFIPCSRHEADILAKLGYAAIPSKVVPLWLDMEFMRGQAPVLDLPYTRPIIPYIGQLTIRKCYDMVVTAMPAVVERFPDASFVFVTHNPEQRGTLQAMAAERGVANNLHFLGTISEEQKLALLRTSDVLPFPSRYEGFGLPILEGMAAEVPIISTRIPVIDELIEDGVSGLLIPYDDSAALAQAMLAILDQPELRAKLVAGGRRAMAEHFDPQQLCGDVIAIYQQVIDQK